MGTIVLADNAQVLISKVKRRVSSCERTVPVILCEQRARINWSRSSRMKRVGYCPIEDQTNYVGTLFNLGACT